jgi:hypothetical protein
LTIRRQMNRQSTDIGCSSSTFTTHRDVIQAQGQTGSKKKSRSAKPVCLSDES